MTRRAFRSTLACVAVSVSLLGAFAEPAMAAVRTVWVSPFGMRDDTFALAVASAGGAVYVAGGGRGGFRDEPFAGLFPSYVRKYDSAGNFLWSREFGHGRSVADDVAADVSGVYVAGREACADHFCGFVRKYDTAGSLVWSRTVGAGKHDVEVHGLSLFGGALYLAGTADGAFPGQSIPGSEGAFVMKLGLDGSKQWVREFGGAEWSFANDVAASRTGIYVTGGTLSGSAADQEGVFIRRYEPDGTLRWSRVIQTGEYGSAIAVRGRSVFVATYRSGRSSDSHAFLRRLDTKDGDLAWTDKVGGYVWTLAPSMGGVLASGNSLRAFGPDGTMRWSFEPDAIDPAMQIFGVEATGRAAFVSGYGRVIGDPIRDDDVFLARLQLPAA